MSASAKMPLARARQLADELVADLAPGCERIAIAGSVRRRKPEVGDIEVVAIPKLKLDLIGEPAGAVLDDMLAAWMADSGLSYVKNGPKYKQIALTRCNLDLFLATPENWGVIFLIRTGSADFARRFVTQQCKGGWLPDDLRVEGGRLWRGGNALPTPEEEDVFRLASVPWKDPRERI